MADPINSHGGSLRPQNAPRPADPEEKDNIRAIVDGDPELQELLQGGPEPIDMLVERDSPTDEIPKISVKKPSEKIKDEERFPWDKSSPPPVEPPVAKPTNGQSTAIADAAPEPEAPEKNEPYVCTFFWENDPDTFSASAMLFGKVSDVAVLFSDIRIRYRSITLADRMSIDDHMPSVQKGEKTPEQLRDEKALIRLAMGVTHVQDRPLGETVQERMKWLRKLPEELIQAMHEAALEYQIRLALRLRGAQEQLKN